MSYFAGLPGPGQLRPWRSRHQEISSSLPQSEWRCRICRNQSLTSSHLISFTPHNWLSTLLSMQERHVSLRVKNLRFLASLNEEALRTQAGSLLNTFYIGLLKGHGIVFKDHGRVWKSLKLFRILKTWCFGQARLFALLERSEGALIPEVACLETEQRRLAAELANLKREAVRLFELKWSWPADVFLREESCRYSKWGTGSYMWYYCLIKLRMAT